jgi:hypothetical protein
MKVLRNVYLAYVLTVAVAHLFLTLSPWTALAIAGSGTEMWLVALLAAWVLAAVFDLILSLFDVVPLSFAGEAVVGMVSLVILSTLTGGMAYVVFATLAPVLVLLKAFEKLAGVDGHFHHVPTT